jgi:hypothetical protein
MAATISSVINNWAGVMVSGTKPISGAPGTEYYNQPVINPGYIPNSIVKGAPNTYWAIDQLQTNLVPYGFAIYKGVFNGTNDIIWSHNFSVTPNSNTALTNAAQFGDFNIAFDPTGNIGWFSFLGHLTPGPSNYAYYPVLYKTTNGGVTWTGPIQVDLNQFSCMTSNITSPNVVSANFEHDLVVDVNGNPHFFTTICNGSNAYGVFYNQWHRMYDITLKNGFWTAFDVANVNAGVGNWTGVQMSMAPQMSRSADGTKLFFSWTDNSSYTLGQANQSPNLFSRAYNVSTNMWSGIKDFSSCNLSTAGKIFFPHIAPEVLEPTLNTFKLAPVYAEFTTIALDPNVVSNFVFLNNVTFATSDFTFTPPAQTISVAQGSNVLFCPNTTVNINVANSPGQVLWSNTSTLSIFPITNASLSPISVTAQVNCAVGSTSVTITTLTLNASTPTPSVCIGNTLNLTATGNALTYVWNPGILTGTSVIVTANTNTLYTLMAMGSSSCSVTNTVLITINPLPTITISGNNTICIGSSFTLTANGASNYLWSNGSTNAIYIDNPQVNLTFTTIGTDANFCINTQTVDVFINSLPIVTAASSFSAVCFGASVSLGATGATTYSWNSVASNSIISITPTATAIYTVLASDDNLCVNSATTSVIVNPVPILVVTPAKSAICKGEKNTLTGGGAATYTWYAVSTFYTASISINPIATAIYSVSGTSSLGCVSSKTYTALVSECLSLNKQTKGDETLVVFPNPSKGELNINLENINITTKIDIYNNLGQKIISKKILHNSTSLDLKEYSNGIYFIYLLEGNDIISKTKFIKE